MVERNCKRDAKWTADVDAAIVSMIAGGSSYLEIAFELGNGLNHCQIPKEVLFRSRD